MTKTLLRDPAALGHLREAFEADVDPALRTDAAAIRAAVTLHDAELVRDFDARRSAYVALANGDGWGSRALEVLLAVEAGRGRIEEGLELARHSIVDGALLGDRGAGAWAAPEVLGVFVEADDIEGTEVALEQLESAARKAGATFATFTVLAFRGGPRRARVIWPRPKRT